MNHCNESSLWDLGWKFIFSYIKWENLSVFRFQNFRKGCDLIPILYFHFPFFFVGFNPKELKGVPIPWCIFCMLY